VRLGFAAVVLLLAACGGSGSGSTATPAPGTGSTATATPGTSSTATPTPTPIIRTATATVNGKSTTILTDAHGMTVYYFTPDSATTTACTGGCAQNWPPVLLPSGVTKPTSGTALPGILGAIMDANGDQVAYQGHPLYTFVGDKVPGDTTGQGLGGGKWLVATLDLAASA
jgi:predicted lipoprotein with Yx(FWY)xxD motif